jgi:hypothetical protein
MIAGDEMNEVLEVFGQLWLFLDRFVIFDIFVSCNQD